MDLEHLVESERSGEWSENQKGRTACLMGSHWSNWEKMNVKINMAMGYN